MPQSRGHGHLQAGENNREWGCHSLRRLIGFACLVVALGALLGLDYAVYVLASFGTCASGGPYVIARPCPAGTGQLIAILLVSIFVALGSGIATWALLGARWGSLVWAGLFVPLGVGFALVGHDNANIAVVFYCLSAMFVIMGIVPLFTSQMSLDNR